MLRLVAAALSAALFVIALPPAADAGTTRAVACSGTTVRALAYRNHGKSGACIARKHALVVETTYYQNASRVGGTALAAFPEARVRFGVTNGIEAFVDTPSEIAKSGAHGSGIYFMTHTGLGVKAALGTAHGVFYSATFEDHPPLDALANLNLEPVSDLHLSANWSRTARTEFSAELGSINALTIRRHKPHHTMFAAGSITHWVNASNALTFELSEQTHAMVGSRAQTRAVASLSRILNDRLLFNIELGTAFNASGNSKPHELGFGFTYH